MINFFLCPTILLGSRRRATCLWCRVVTKRINLEMSLLLLTFFPWRKNAAPLLLLCVFSHGNMGWIWDGTMGGGSLYFPT